MSIKLNKCKLLIYIVQFLEPVNLHLCINVNIFLIFIKYFLNKIKFIKLFYIFITLLYLLICVQNT